MNTDNPTIDFEAFKTEWLAVIEEGNPSTVELGRRFARKLVTQWKDVREDAEDLFYCDGSGDGGIDVAYLDFGETEAQEDAENRGHIWYLVQSKYGSAFRGTNTLLTEGQKIIETLDGRRSGLSSLAEDVLERLRLFRQQASDRDRIILVFATEISLDEVQKRVLKDLRAMGRERLGPLFDVEAISIQTVYERQLETELPPRLRAQIKAQLVSSGEGLLVGSTRLLDLYEFLRLYRDYTEDLDRLYEKNVRKFLGAKTKVNKAIRQTLIDCPDKFGLYNNGITFVVEDFALVEEGVFELTEPFIVNGCQSTRTVWDVFDQRLRAGGTGINRVTEEWLKKAERSVVITKIVKVGVEGSNLLEQITRNTNTQTGIREKDFLALQSDFRSWARVMEENYNVYLEIQRGGWDSRRALQKRKPNIKQLTDAANAFDLLKVYGAGWLGEAGTAFSKNAPFLPGGNIYDRITNSNGGDDAEQFNVEDFYAAYMLQRSADGFNFGRRAETPARKQTRFLFYMITIDLLKEILNRADLKVEPKTITRAMLRLFSYADKTVREEFLSAAVEAIDGYMTQNTDNCVHDEPAFRDENKFNLDLNAFLKWDRLGKSEDDTPRLRTLLAVTKMMMGQKRGSIPSIRDRVIEVIKEE